MHSTWDPSDQKCVCDSGYYLNWDLECQTGHPPRGHCRYYHKSTGRTDWYDAHGHQQSCYSAAPQRVWYEQCRDHVDDTDEIGCEQ